MQELNLFNFPKVNKFACEDSKYALFVESLINLNKVFEEIESLHEDFQIFMSQLCTPVIRTPLVLTDATERSGAEEALERREGGESYGFLCWRWQQQRKQQVRGGRAGRKWRRCRTSRRSSCLFPSSATSVAQPGLSQRRSRWAKFRVPYGRWKWSQHRAWTATWLRNWFCSGTALWNYYHTVEYKQVNSYDLIILFLKMVIY